MNKTEIKVKILESIREFLKQKPENLFPEAKDLLIGHQANHNLILINKGKDEIDSILSEKIYSYQKFLNPERNMKAQYLYKTGIVEDIDNYTKGLDRWGYIIKLEDPDPNANIVEFKLLKGKFNKKTAPQIGDKVRIQSRITKNRDYFSYIEAKICEKIS